MKFIFRILVSHTFVLINVLLITFKSFSLCIIRLHWTASSARGRCALLLLLDVSFNCWNVQKFLNKVLHYLSTVAIVIQFWLDGDVIVVAVIVVFIGVVVVVWLVSSENIQALTASIKDYVYVVDDD